MVTVSHAFLGTMVRSETDATHPTWTNLLGHACYDRHCSTSLLASDRDPDPGTVCAYCPRRTLRLIPNQREL